MKAFTVRQSDYLCKQTGWKIQGSSTETTSYEKNYFSRIGPDGKPTTYGLQHRKWSNAFYQFDEKGRANYYLNLRKRKAKIMKEFSKIARLDEQESSV